MLTMRLKRIDDGTVDEVTTSQYAHSRAGVILTFSAGGAHFHLGKHHDRVNYFNAVKGGAAGAAAGMAGGPEIMLVGAAVGSVIALAAPKVLAGISNHQGRLSYFDEHGGEVYEGPATLRRG